MKLNAFHIFTLLLAIAYAGCSQNGPGNANSSSATPAPAAPAETFEQLSPGSPPDCVELYTLIDSTYGFKPSKLTKEERTAKSAEMDTVWKKVTADKKKLLPCLRTAISTKKGDSFFRFDASQLLITLDESEDASKLWIQGTADVDFTDIDSAYWMPRIAKYGNEGLDTSAAGENWLGHPNPGYYLPQHGSQKVDKKIGALIAYGSMDEAIATPALAKIAGTTDHPGREIAVRLLMQQVTPESFSVLRKIDTGGLSAQTVSELKTLLTEPVLLAKREGIPQATREQYLEAFKDLNDGKPDTLLRLASQSPDGERDVIAVMKDEDIPIIRKARRNMLRPSNPHSADWYDSFTKILLAMVWKPEAAKPVESK